MSNMASTIRGALVCVCVCARARARGRACACVCSAVLKSCGTEGNGVPTPKTHLHNRALDYQPHPTTASPQ